MSVVGLGALAPNKPLVLLKYDIENADPRAVHIEVAFCGICPADCSVVENQKQHTHYPIVPGHEITGVVIGLGPEATKFDVGERVGVGCLCWSCGQCDACKGGYEHYCPQAVFTYNGILPGGTLTRGGYGSKVIVNEDFVVSIPHNIRLDHAAPLMCAGVSVFSPLIYNKINRGGYKVGIIGFGSAGYLALLFARAFGNEVTVFMDGSSSSCRQEAIRMGAKHVIDSSDRTALGRMAGKLNFILDTVCDDNLLELFMKVLHFQGVYVFVGLPASSKVSLNGMHLLRRTSIQGSMFGPIREIQQMLEVCAEKKIEPLINAITLDQVESAFVDMKNSSSMVRYVIDMKRSTEKITTSAMSPLPLQCGPPIPLKSFEKISPIFCDFTDRSIHHHAEVGA